MASRDVGVLKTIVRALGGDLYGGGRRANVPAPGHSRADRSVSLLLSGGRIVVHSFGGADWREVLDDLRARRLLDGLSAPETGGLERLPDLDAPLRRERLAVARGLWRGAGPVLPGTESARWLALRGIRAARPSSDALRHHPAVPLSVYRPSDRTRPALLAAISDAEGALTAVEVTYLDASGRRAEGLRISRKTVGLVPPSSAVRLAPSGPHLLVGEGVFTTLSACERFGLPGWALLSTGNLRSWRPPEGVRRVLVAADRGGDGLRSAAVLAARLRAGRVPASVRPPPAPHEDWNDWAQALAGGEWGGESEGRARPGGAGELP
jgi:hypothetical protein